MSKPALLIERVAEFGPQQSLLSEQGRASYHQWLDAASRVASALLAGRRDLEESRVGYLVEPGIDHVAAQWGIWLAGGIAVPIAQSHPAREIEYLLDNSEATSTIASPELASRLAPLAEARGIRLLTTDAARLHSPAPLPVIGPDRRALMVYTSGTTGRPKGVITTHAAIQAQVSTLANAWEWTHHDRSLHLLPLHHIHGIINALSCALWVGASIEFLGSFNAERTWERLASGEITFFTAVPTIYHRLIASYDLADRPTRQRWSGGASQLRVMLSGSAALPVSTLLRWEAITGHRLLERYGMTEIGMALSNPLHGERRAGTVGMPLPGVQARLVDDGGAPVPAGVAGQIEIKGPQLFLEYWGRGEETAKEFRDGWFQTGDVAQIEDGYWRILGRQSVDIIKSAGYKISALEIEEVLREHPNITDCAVIGRPDPDLGERVAAAIVSSIDLAPEEVRAWLKDRLAPYKVPRDVLQVAELPRNAMGKVTKPELRSRFP